MPACETLHGWRVIATPAALDHLAWESTSADSFVLRLAPDDALVVSASRAPTVDDPHAIVEPDSGWSAWRYDEAAFEAVAAHHIEWSLPHDRPALAQGLVAGVPAKVWFAGGTVLVICASAYAAELDIRIVAL